MPLRQAFNLGWLPLIVGWFSIMYSRKCRFLRLDLMHPVIQIKEPACIHHLPTTSRIPFLPLVQIVRFLREKPILVELDVLWFSDIVSHPSLRKSLWPWREILCSPKRIMRTCLPVEKGKALMKTGVTLFSSCNFLPVGLWTDRCFAMTDAKRISFCCLDKPVPICWSRRGC